MQTAGKFKCKFEAFTAGSGTGSMNLPALLVTIRSITVYAMPLKISVVHGLTWPIFLMDQQ